MTETTVTDADYEKRNRRIARQVEEETDRTLREIGEEHGITRTRVAQVAKAHGVVRERGPVEGEERVHGGRPVKYLPDHHRADRDGWVQERYLAAEEKLGRRLEDEELVVHADGDPENLDPENLRVMTRSEYSKELASRESGARWRTRDAMLLALRWLAVYLGRTPRAVDVNFILPFSHVHYYDEFGSMRNAHREAGLEPNRRGGEAEALTAEFEKRWARLSDYEDVEVALEAEINESKEEVA